ncbi:helix-turn-helix transcriptional regulator [bacterium]|nr:helix-turn-helix transcriptional regulator [bacterium]
MGKDFKYIIGRNIKAERLRKDFTQEVFAEMIDMSLSYVSKVEQGLTSPTAIVLYKMSKVLAIPMEEFFKGVDITPEL